MEVETKDEEDEVLDFTVKAGDVPCVRALLGVGAVNLHHLFKGMSLRDFQKVNEKCSSAKDGKRLCEVLSKCIPEMATTEALMNP